MPTILKGVTVGVAALVGGLLVASGAYSCFKEYGATKWPRADGVVVASEVQVGRGGRSGPSRTPQIRYAYVVDGERLFSDRVEFGWTGAVLPLAATADSLVAAYPEGAQVQVYYNPHHHGEAVLQPGRYLAAWVTIALGAFAIGSAIRGYRIGLAA